VCFIAAPGLGPGHLQCLPWHRGVLIQKANFQQLLQGDYAFCKILFQKQGATAVLIEFSASAQPQNVIKQTKNVKCKHQVSKVTVMSKKMAVL